jgi:uncharacterized protein DUF4236
VGLRYHHRLALLPGLRINLSRSGASVSVGHRGAWYTVGPAAGALRLVFQGPA